MSGIVPCARAIYELARRCRRHQETPTLQYQQFSLWSLRSMNPALFDEPPVRWDQIAEADDAGPPVLVQDEGGRLIAVLNSVTCGTVCISVPASMYPNGHVRPSS